MLAFALAGTVFCMASKQPQALAYQRARFTALLPRDRAYTPTHFWLRQQEGAWRVGLTKFGSRLLGEIVDYGFEVSPGAPVRSGQKIGWVEGFKSLTEIPCLIEGRFVGANPALEESPSLVNQDPHGAGWLYEVQGMPDRAALDAEAYAKVLDVEIDRRLGAS